MLEDRFKNSRQKKISSSKKQTPRNGFLNLSSGSNDRRRRKPKSGYSTQVFDKLIDLWNESVESRKCTKRTRDKIIIHFQKLNTGTFFEDKTFSEAFYDYVNPDKLRQEISSGRKYSISEIEYAIKELALCTKNGFYPINKDCLGNLDQMFYNTYTEWSYFVYVMINGAMKIGETSKKAKNDDIRQIQDAFFDGAGHRDNFKSREFYDFAKGILSYTFSLIDAPVSSEEVSEAVLNIAQLNAREYGGWLKLNKQDKARFSMIKVGTRLFSVWHYRLNAMNYSESDVSEFVLPEEKIRFFNPKVK